MIVSIEVVLYVHRVLYKYFAERGEEGMLQHFKVVLNIA